MRPRVYLETTIISYLTAMPSRDLVRAARQQITAEWWESRGRFELYVSEAVVAEARRGDVAAADRRLAVIEGLPLLAATQEAMTLAEDLIRGAAMPRTAALDAVHVAIATVHGAEFLMTWNCRHIANAAIRPRIEAICRQAGFLSPVICTPEELVEWEDHDEG